MFAKFNKIGVASAVAAAVGASGAAHALILGTAADAFLIPHVLYDSAVQANTLIGVTVAGPDGLGDDPTVLPTLQNDAATDPGDGCLSGANIHVYFFSVRSVHLADVMTPTTCEDFVRIDWGGVVKSFFPTLDGVPGYIVVADEAARNNAGSALALFAAAYLIQGNWASQAFIPALPIVDDGIEIAYTSGIPSTVNPITAGMPLATDGTSESAIFSLRYFLDPALNGHTRFVLWFPDNRDSRNNLPIEVYDANEGHISFTTSAPDELNIIDASTLGGTINGPSNPLPGTQDLTDLAQGGPAVNSGFVLFNIADGVSTGTDLRGGISFSLIAIGGGFNADQVQTELAHERGLFGGAL